MAAKKKTKNKQRVMYLHEYKSTGSGDWSPHTPALDASRTEGDYFLVRADAVASARAWARISSNLQRVVKVTREVVIEVSQ